MTLLQTLWPYATLIYLILLFCLVPLVTALIESFKGDDK